MTKRMFLTAALGGFPLLKAQSSVAEEAAPATESGAIAAQVAGRVVLALDGTLEVFQYYLFIDGLGADVFAGQPSERTAHFTLRTDRLRPIFTQNGDVMHIGFQPAGTEGLYRVYYNPSPQNRDFSRPETFSTGLQIAAFKSRRTQATLIPGSHALVTGTGDMVETADFTFRERKLNVASLFKSITFTFHVRPFALGDVGITTLSLPFGGHLVKVG